MLLRRSQEGGGGGGQGGGRGGGLQSEGKGVKHCWAEGGNYEAKQNLDTVLPSMGSRTFNTCMHMLT